MRHYLAIDPGEVNNGVAYMSTQPSGRLIRHWTRNLSRKTLYTLALTADVDGFVIEEYRLYPELAREQGYSDFPTVEIIGVLKYIADQRRLQYAMQGASLKSKSRGIGARVGNHLGSLRSIGTGRSRRLGWDWTAPTQHERDATSHGVWYALRNAGSELFERDYEKNGGVVLGWD